MNRLCAVALATFALLAGVGCGSTSCSDACNTLVTCLDKFTPGQTEVTTTNCDNSCNSATCSNKQHLIDCIHGASCNGTAAEYTGALLSCQTQNPGCFTP
jgi:hypothetical protein